MTAPSDHCAATEPGSRLLGEQIAAPEAKAIRRGSSIGRYLVLERLGAGGMGVVYAAFDPDLDRKVAVKLLHRDQRGSGNLAEQRLLREAQALAKLDHPNVVRVHDVGTVDGAVFVAMEFVEGQTLRGWLAEPRASTEVVQALLQAGQGLAAAHSSGLVHRDFKPDNVMVGIDGRVRVMDFGLVRSTEAPADRQQAVTEPTTVGGSLEPPEALGGTQDADAAMARVRAKMAGAGKLAAGAGTDTTLDAEPARPAAAVPSPAGSELTRTGALLGTPAYMSPEQIHGSAVDARTDQFSFAITAWEALIGTRPFVGTSVIAMTDAIVRGELQPPPPDHGLSNAVLGALTRALSTDREARFADMSGLLTALTPTAPTQSRALWGGLGLAAGGVLLGAVLLAGADPAVCQSGAARAETAWSPMHAEAMRAAFGATGVNHATATADHVAAQLDSYAQRLAGQHDEACAATVIRGEQSEAVLDLRMACLDSRLAELSALSQILQSADSGTTERATEAAAHLPAIDVCADRAALTRTTEPPSSASRDQIADVRQTLAQAHAQQKTGHYAEAETAAASATAAAEQLGYRPLLAEAAWASGLVAADLGHTGDAIGKLIDATLHARASGHLQVAAEAQARLTFVVGHSAGRLQDGLLWSRQAAAEIDRLGGDRPVRADLSNHRGVLLQASGDTEGALREFASALKSRQRLLGEHHPDTAEARFNLGVLYRRTGEYTKARVEHVRALEIRQRVFGSAHPKVAESLLALGTVLAREGSPAGARVRFAEALAIQRAARGEDHLATARTYEALASLEASEDNAEPAREHFMAALAVYERRLSDDDPRLSRVWMNLGGFERKAGNIAQALRYFERAAAAVERSRGPDHAQLALVLANLGSAHLSHDDPKAAVEVLRRATKILVESESESEPVVVGTALADLAEALAQTGLPASDTAAHAETWLSKAGAAGQARLRELRQWQEQARPR